MELVLLIVVIAVVAYAWGRQSSRQQAHRDLQGDLSLTEEERARKRADLINNTKDRIV